MVAVVGVSVAGRGPIGLSNLRGEGFGPDRLNKDFDWLRQQVSGRACAPGGAQSLVKTPKDTDSAVKDCPPLVDIGRLKDCGRVGLRCGLLWQAGSTAGRQ